MVKVISTPGPKAIYIEKLKLAVLYKLDNHEIFPRLRGLFSSIHIYLLIGLRTYRTSVGPRSECSQEQPDPDPHCFSFKLQKHFCIRRMKTTYCDWRS